MRKGNKRRNKQRKKNNEGANKKAHRDGKKTWKEKTDVMKMCISRPMACGGGPEAVYCI